MSHASERGSVDHDEAAPPTRPHHGASPQQASTEAQPGDVAIRDTLHGAVTAAELPEWFRRPQLSAESEATIARGLPPVAPPSEFDRPPIAELPPIPPTRVRPVYEVHSRDLGRPHRIPDDTPVRVVLGYVDAGDVDLHALSRAVIGVATGHSDLFLAGCGSGYPLVVQLVSDHLGRQVAA